MKTLIAVVISVLVGSQAASAQSWGRTDCSIARDFFSAAIEQFNQSQATQHELSWRLRSAIAADDLPEQFKEESRAVLDQVGPREWQMENAALMQSLISDRCG